MFSEDMFKLLLLSQILKGAIDMPDDKDETTSVDEEVFEKYCDKPSDVEDDSDFNNFMYKFLNDIDEIFEEAFKEFPSTNFHILFDSLTECLEEKFGFKIPPGFRSNMEQRCSDLYKELRSNTKESASQSFERETASIQAKIKLLNLDAANIIGDTVSAYIDKAKNNKHLRDAPFSLSIGNSRLTNCYGLSKVFECDENTSYLIVHNDSYEDKYFAAYSVFPNVTAIHVDELYENSSVVHNHTHIIMLGLTTAERDYIHFDLLNDNHYSISLDCDPIY